MNNKTTQSLKQHSIRIQLLLYIVAGMMLIMGSYTALSVTNIRKQNEIKEARHLRAIQQEMQNEVDVLIQSASGFAQLFSFQENIKQFVLVNDHHGLKKDIVPIFQEMHDKYNVSHLYIHAIDGIILLRGHAPDEFGDFSFCYRSTLKTAKETKATTGGIEFDINRLGIRGTAPILVDNKLIGLVEVGHNYDLEYLQKLKERTGMDYRIWVSYETASLSGFWPDSAAPTSPTDKIFYYASTKANMPVLNSSEYDKVLEKEVSVTNFIKVQNQSLAVLLTPIYGYEGKKIGIIELQHDRTESLAVIKQDQIKALLLTTLLAVIGIGFMWVILTRFVLKPLSYLVQIAQRQHKGELTARARIERTDEFGLLGETFDALSDKLEKTLTKQSSIIETLQETEENLRITLHSIGDAVITTDIKGCVMRMNPTAEKLTGYSIDDAKGLYILKVFHIINARTRELCENPIEKILKTSKAIELTNDTILVAKDGIERQIADAGTPIHNDDGELVGTVLVFRDVTEQAQLIEQLHQSKKMQAIGQLAGGIAHDFNNMLGGIIGAAELLEIGLPKEDQKKNHVFIHLILETAQRAAELTEKLLAFSRKGTRIVVPLDLHAVIQDAVAILERSIDKRIDIKLNMNAITSTILGDKSQLQNAILNLGVNARDAMIEGGEITIETNNISLNNEYCRSKTSDLKSGYYVQLTIQDTGVGIPPDIQNKVFEPFFTTKKTGKGTGLGLSAVYGTIRDHQGDITVYSEIDKGTIFHIYLPISNETVKFEEKPTKEKLLTGCGLILVIDDEKMIRTTSSNILKKLGYDVIVAENGEHGVELYKKNSDRIKLVVLDMVMPKMNGK
ncbi:MAG: PAS domain S-box protein, partial [Alphaproteobacteria bacterium]|nr:PAS domain S-box protein [Alphaproteobacteria bacterium]